MADKKAKPGAKTASTPPPAKKAAVAPAKSAKPAPKANKTSAAGRDAAGARDNTKVAGVAPTAVYKSHSFRRKMVGVVTSDKMDKTVTVEVVRRSVDPVYKKYVRQRSKYKAHDPSNAFKTGDRVEITEHAPISREKRWLVTRLIARRVEA